jgi:hypothetical protein
MMSGMSLLRRMVRHSSKPSISGSMTSRMAASNPPLCQPRQTHAGAQSLLQRQVEALEVGCQRGAELGVVIDQQDAGHGAILSFMHVGLALCTRCGDQPRWYQRPRLSMNSRTFCCWAGFRLS